MSDLEKIIYIADAVEEGRNYPGVNEMREVAYKNLDEAILMEANRKIEYLIKLDAIIHPSTVEMRNWLVEKVRKN
jgi:HD superfamily phosphohydrolase YqeK